MRIGELARRTNVSERSLRYYEEQNLLTAERDRAGRRVYAETAIDRVIRIQQLFAAGLCSAKIVQLLPCLGDTDDDAAQTATPRLVGELSIERDRINRMIGDLVRSREVLDEVIQAADSAAKPG